MKKIRFAYLSAEDPRDKKVWSGTLYSIYSQLQTLGEVEVLGPYKPRIRTFFAKILNQLYLKTVKKRISYRHSSFISKGHAAYFNSKLARGGFDYIVAPAACGEIANLNTTIPIIYITDGTFACCLNYHKALSNLTSHSIHEGNKIEQAAIDKSKYVVVPSEWAAKSVMQDYGANKQKVITFPYGANFDRLPLASELNLNAPTLWNLLFVGVYWDNKGGNIAFNAFKQLHDKGYAVSLTVLGCIPPPDIKHQHMRVIPFIDKNSEAGQTEMFEIYKANHLLLLPTRFDCSPIVINEASAFGMPALVANSGGVAGHLKHNVNGFLIDYNDTGAAYARRIEELIQSPKRYVELRKSSRKLYEAELNWKHWTDEFRKLL